MTLMQHKEKMMRFLELLQQWNKAYNLTAITDPKKMLTHHLLDSLSVKEYIKGEHILDVGTGAGFPGIPLAICFPQKEFTLLDSRGKKTCFLQQVKSQLCLENVKIVNDRMENYQAVQAYDVIICRAVGNSLNIVNMTAHLASKNASWLMMKGSAIKTELEELDKVALNYSVHTLTVKGLDEVRQLIIIKK